MKRLCMAAIVAAFAFAFIGCEKDTTKAEAEKAGKTIEKAAKDAGNAIESAAKDLSNKLK